VADIQTKVEELEQPNQAMSDRDKMKDDAIAHLSDQLMTYYGFLCVQACGRSAEECPSGWINTRHQHGEIR
jgi:hypothetical protein